MRARINSDINPLRDLRYMLLTCDMSFGRDMPYRARGFISYRKRPPRLYRSKAPLCYIARRSRISHFAALPLNINSPHKAKRKPLGFLFILSTYFLSIYSHALRAATAPSETAVAIWRTAFTRQSPAVKMPSVRVLMSFSAAM